MCHFVIVNKDGGPLREKRYLTLNLTKIVMTSRQRYYLQTKEITIKKSKRMEIHPSDAPVRIYF